MILSFEKLHIQKLCVSICFSSTVSFSKQVRFLTNERKKFTKTSFRIQDHIKQFWGGIYDVEDILL